ncbi:MAG: transporter suffix domain-containing protein [Prolixibacteraceae bacterium]
MKKTIKFKIGAILILVSVVLFLLIPVIPFLSITRGVKITISTVLFVLGEITFWSGGILLGKELLDKYKSYLNPKNWKSKDEKLE